jgi:hypothetical protein
MGNLMETIVSILAIIGFVSIINHIFKISKEDIKQTGEKASQQMKENVTEASESVTEKIKEKVKQAADNMSQKMTVEKKQGTRYGSKPIRY